MSIVIILSLAQSLCLSTRVQHGAELSELKVSEMVLGKCCNVEECVQFILSLTGC